MGLGYQVLEAPGPGEARSLAGSYPGQIDLLLSDVVMPGMQGPELAKQILEIRPGIKILYSSGFTQDAKITQSEGVGYLPKPYTLDALARAVRSVLDNERLWVEAGADATEE
jgi:CheY-like chemotaxis protein